MYDTLGSPRTSCFALQRKQQHFSHEHFHSIAVQTNIKLWHSSPIPSSPVLKYNVLLSWCKLTPWFTVKSAQSIKHLPCTGDGKGNSDDNLGEKWGQSFGCQCSSARYKGLFTVEKRTENSSVKCSHVSSSKALDTHRDWAGYFLFVWVFGLLFYFFVWLVFNFHHNILPLCYLRECGMTWQRIKKKSLYHCSHMLIVHH